MRKRGEAETTDEDLVRRYRENPGEAAGRDAAEELFERYWERVYLWCLRRVGHHETARDLAQDVLLSAYRALPGFEGRSLYSSWLFTIMRHRCFRALRRPGWIRDDEVAVDALTAAAPPADSVLESEEEEEAILELVLRTLDPVEQAALWLRVIERLPVDEITRRLQLTSASGARGVLQNGRRKLRAALDRRARQGGQLS